MRKETKRLREAAEHLFNVARPLAAGAGLAEDEARLLGHICSGMSWSSLSRCDRKVAAARAETFALILRGEVHDALISLRNALLNRGTHE